MIKGPKGCWKPVGNEQTFVFAFWVIVYDEVNNFENHIGNYEMVKMENISKKALFIILLLLR